MYADPNSVKRIFIPVVPMGEIEGRVTKIDEFGKSSPAGRIPMVITDASGVIVGRANTDASGYYNYAELKPGSYTVSPDPDAMARARLSTTRERVVSIVPMAEGDYQQGIDFVVSPPQE